MRASLSETLCRPLGFGYEDYPSLVQQYAYPSVHNGRTPDLGTSLAGLRQAGVSDALDLSLGENPCCLIQGISCPRNGTVLREFLESQGIVAPKILAIGIANIAAVLAAMKMSLPDVQFSVADASRLSSFPNGSVQLLVQDHLLNCAPHAMHEGIIREAARVLDTCGFLILNFSVDPSGPEKHVSELTDFKSLSWSPFDERAYCLSDLGLSKSSGDRLALIKTGAIVRLDKDRSIVVTPPSGNFEFYFPKSKLENLLLCHGLEFIFATSETGIDRNGFSCVRYRTIVRHAK